MNDSLKIVKIAPDHLIVANHILADGSPETDRPTPVTLPSGVVIGAVNWDTLKSDSSGWWVERVLARRTKYLELLKSLVEQGLICTEPVCQPSASKSAGGVIICRDVLRLAPTTTKAMDFEISIMSRVLGLDYDPSYERLRLKARSMEVLCYSMT